MATISNYGGYFEVLILFVKIHIDVKLTFTRIAPRHHLSSQHFLTKCQVSILYCTYLYREHTVLIEFTTN